MRGTDSTIPAMAFHLTRINRSEIRTRNEDANLLSSFQVDMTAAKTNHDTQQVAHNRRDFECRLNGLPTHNQTRFLNTSTRYLLIKHAWLGSNKMLSRMDQDGPKLLEKRQEGVKGDLPTGRLEFRD